MLTEEQAVNIQQMLRPLIDVSDLDILYLSEVTSSVPAWCSQDDDAIVLKVSLLENPSKNVIKILSDVCYHGERQIHTSEETEVGQTVLVLPTENGFQTLYEVCGPPQPSQFSTTE